VNKALVLQMLNFGIESLRLEKTSKIIKSNHHKALKKTLKNFGNVLSQYFSSGVPLLSFSKEGFLE